jgi:LmbE family N-acetylglucosaminyl deacetylase
MTTIPTLLAVGAHPDDLEIGCAGALLRWAHRYRLVFVVATAGERSQPCGSDRLIEAEKVAAGFGAVLEPLGLADGDLGPLVDVVAKLEALDERYRPARALIPTRLDSHQDHRKLGRAAIPAFRRVDQLLTYEAHTTESFRPSYFVDIAAYIDRKCELLTQYESQAGKLAISSEYIRATARQWSVKHCRADGYAEAFEVVRFIEHDGG